MYSRAQNDACQKLILLDRTGGEAALARGQHSEVSHSICGIPTPVHLWTVLLNWKINPMPAKVLADKRFELLALPEEFAF